jgi:tagatose-1,6-bisphosphate aldolase
MVSESKQNTANAITNYSRSTILDKQFNISKNRNRSMAASV